MFLCEKCHNHDHPGDYRHQGGSFGPCEACHKTADCVDCKWIPDKAHQERFNQIEKLARRNARKNAKG